MATHEGRWTWHRRHVANSGEEEAEAFAGEEEEEGVSGAVGEAVGGAEAFSGAETVVAEGEVEQAEATGVIVTVGQAEGEREGKEEEEDGLLSVKAISLWWL